MEGQMLPRSIVESIQAQVEQNKFQVITSPLDLIIIVQDFNTHKFIKPYISVKKDSVAE